MGRKRFVFSFVFEILSLESLSLDWLSAVPALLYYIYSSRSCEFVMYIFSQSRVLKLAEN